VSRRAKPHKDSNPVSVTTLTEDAYRVIKWRITTVQLAPGTTFTESDLSESLRLSRTPVREALLLLRTEGLVSVEGRSGYRVSPVTLRDVHDLAMVRRLLEGEAAYLAAPRLTEPGQLETLIGRMPVPLDDNQPGAAPMWIEADRRFHLALVTASGSLQLVQALEPLLERSARLLHLVLALESPPSAVGHDHADLVTALRSRDRERARGLVVEQVACIEETVTRALTSSLSLMTANVVVEKPNNQFYLDANPAQLAADGQSTPSSTDRTTAAYGSHKTRVGVKQ
jgi:DNA-binding GntR family transcriptional regulator